MRFLILTGGSYGDALPFLALAHRLKEAGHDVTLGTRGKFRALADEYGVRLLSLDDHENVRARTTVAQLNATQPRGLARLRQRARAMNAFATVLARYHDEIATGYAQLPQPPDVVVYHYPLICGDEVADKFAVPGIPVCLQPFWVPTQSFPSATVPFPVPKTLNRLSYRYGSLHWRSLHAYAASQRHQKLGTHRWRGFRDHLRGSGKEPAAVLQAFSSHVMPTWPVYPDRIYTTNFWFLPPSPNWVPPRELKEFLQAGDPPLCVGFGSSVGADPQRTTQRVIDAARAEGMRVLLVGGNGGLTDTAASDDVLYVPQVPFSWLIPRTAAVLHHGGVGTTSTALAAGKPQIICPFGGEHEYFAERMRALGVASVCPPQHVVTREDLQTAIRDVVSSEVMSEQAHELSLNVAEHDGTGAAVWLLEGLG